MKPFGRVEFRKNRQMTINAAVAVAIRHDGRNLSGITFEFLVAKTAATEIEPISKARVWSIVPMLSKTDKPVRAFKPTMALRTFIALVRLVARKNTQATLTKFNVIKTARNFDMRMFSLSQAL
jgi:hypothetical protein